MKVATSEGQIFTAFSEHMESWKSRSTRLSSCRSGEDPGSFWASQFCIDVAQESTIIQSLSQIMSLEALILHKEGTLGRADERYSRCTDLEDFPSGEDGLTSSCSLF